MKYVGFEVSGGELIRLVEAVAKFEHASVISVGDPSAGSGGQLSECYEAGACCITKFGDMIIPDSKGDEDIKALLCYLEGEGFSPYYSDLPHHIFGECHDLMFLLNRVMNSVGKEKKQHDSPL